MLNKMCENCLKLKECGGTDNMIWTGCVFREAEDYEAKRKRIFETYRKRLERESGDKKENRFNTIEYLCSFPKINPYDMAAVMIMNGYKISFDDSSISKAENERKRKAVEKLVIVL